METKPLSKKEMMLSLLKGASFIILLIALFLGMNEAYSHLVLGKTTLRERDAQFQMAKQDIPILMLGDSATTADLNPRFIDGSFNYGIPGATYAQTYYQFKRLVEVEGLRPDIVILPFSEHSFSSYRAARIQDKWYWDDYIDYEELSTHFEDIDPFAERIKGEFPFIGGGEMLLASSFEDEGVGMILGHVPMKGRFSDSSNQEKIASQRAAYHFRNATLLHPALLDYFSRTLDLAEKYNITVFLIKFPVTDTYDRIAGEYILNQEELFTEPLSIASTHPSVHILDYQKEFATNHTLFADSVHLNVEGNEIFSLQVQSDINDLRSSFSSSEDHNSTSTQSIGGESD